MVEISLSDFRADFELILGRSRGTVRAGGLLRVGDTQTAEKDVLCRVAVERGDWVVRYGSGQGRCRVRTVASPHVPNVICE